MICEIISYQSSATEMKVVKDADALAFFADKKLYMLWIEWAHSNGLDSEISRKLNKYKGLHFDVSRRIGKPLFDNMKKDWDDYLTISS